MIQFNKYKYIYLPFLSGLLVAIGRLPLRLGLVSFFALIPLIMLFQENLKFKHLFAAGFFYSFSYTSVALHWIALVTVPGYIGIYFLFTLYFGILFSLIYFVSKRIPKFRMISFTFFWISFDYLQNFGEFRFPWFDIGYSLADFNLLIQPVEIGGIYILSLIIILINFLIIGSFKHKRNFIFIFILIVIWISYGYLRINNLKTEISEKKIGIIQASIPQEMKWQRAYLDTTINFYTDLSLSAKDQGASIILWPESAWPVYLTKQMKYKYMMKDLVNDLGIPVVAGYPDYIYPEKPHPEKYKFYNSASFFYPDGTIGNPYYKNYLVPFGERMPFLSIFPALWNVHLGQANFEYGNKLEFYDYEGLRFSPQICFEIAFSIQTTKMVRNGTDIILNLTNDAWFKRSIGTYQHAMLSRFRAVETRRQIIRAANTGYSMIVSPSGEIIQKTDLFERTMFVDNLEICKIVTINSRYFNWLPKFLLFLSLILMIMALVKKIK